jgi:hypothetical protein
MINALDLHTLIVQIATTSQLDVSYEKTTLGFSFDIDTNFYNYQCNKCFIVIIICAHCYHDDVFVMPLLKSNYWWENTSQLEWIAKKKSQNQLITKFNK